MARGRWHRPGTRVSAKFGGRDVKTGKPFAAGTLIECDKSGYGWFVVEQEIPKKPAPIPLPDIRDYLNPAQAPEADKEGLRVTTMSYPDFAAFYHAANREDTTRYKSSKGYNRGFHHYRSWEKANNAALLGDEKLLEEVQALASQIKAGMGHAEKRVHSVHSIAGGRVNLGAYLMGDPEDMYRYKSNIRQGSKILSLHISLNAHCGVDEELMRRRGAAVLALTDILTDAGYDVEVFASMIASKSPKSKEIMRILVPVKRSFDRVDLTRLSYALGSPDMLRRHCIAIMDTESDYMRTWEGPHGYPQGMDKYMPDLCPADIYVFSEAEDYAQFSTAEKARQWVEQQIIAQGIAYPYK